MPPLTIRRIPLQFKQSLRAFRSFSPHHVSVSPSRCISAAPRVFGSKKEDDDWIVNYFDEDEGPDPKRRRMDSDLNEEDTEGLKARIAFLEEEIKQFSMPKEMPEELARQLFSKEELEEGMEGLENELADLDILPHQLKPKKTLSNESQIYVDCLNDRLDDASLDPSNPSARKEVWKYYERSKNRVADLFNMIPQAGWDLLWLSQSANNPSNPDRASHLKIIAQDLMLAGRQLTAEQRYARIEGIFLEGHRNKALDEWETAAQTSDASDPNFLEIGLRMYAYLGNATRALGLLEEIFKVDTTWNPRIILPVISAFASLKNDYGNRKAFTLYMRLRRRLSSDITMEDYDTISLGFLAAGQKDYALAVFRDMMLSADPTADASGSVYRMVHDRVGQFISSSEDVAEVNNFSLDAIIYLPRRFQNKFFYASWVKKLIGMGETDSAAQVIELMYERNVKPDAKHLNGLLAAWIRDGAHKAQTKAVVVAWAMIQHRIDFTQQRAARKAAGKAVIKKSVVQNEEGLHIEFQERKAPPATAETFSILIQYFLRRGMFGHVVHLRNLLVEAEIPMNSYFMNHLLYAELRNRSHREVWSRFEVMSRTVKPDIETWLCLWECMKFHVDTTQNRNPSGFPNPHQLFARMIEWFSNLKGQELRDALGDMNIDTYHDIIRCFCLSRDLEGSFIVMHTIKKLFNLYPEEKTVRMLILQISRLNAARPKTAATSRYITMKSKEIVTQITEILDIITQERRDRLREKGHVWDELEDMQRAEENHRALLQLLYTVWKRRQGPLTFFNGAIKETCIRMGVEPFDAEEAMSLIV